MVKTNLLIAVAGLGIGGAEVIIQHLVRSIDRRRFNVTVCCIKGAGPLGEALAREGYDVVALSEPGRTRPDYFTFTKMRKLIQERRIDIVHSHTTDALADAAVCRLLSRRLKLLHTFHFGNYPRLDDRQLLIERVFLRCANQLVAVGEVQRAQIRATYHLRESAIGRVWNGVPLRLPKADGTFRARLGVGNDVIVGTVATLIPQKGLDDLLRVASALRVTGRRIHFVVIGDGRLRADLELKRDELGLQGSVTFAGWIADASQRAVPEFDVFFQPSLWEAMSIAVLEAMAAGVPVVATKVGENTYIIDDGQNGMLVEPRDVASMTDALCRLVDDAELRRRIGEAGRRKVESQFTVEHMTRAYERLYMKLDSATTSHRQSSGV